MVYASTVTRLAPLRKVFGEGRSQLLVYLAQMSVLYEDLRIETFGITADGDDLKRLDYLDNRYRTHYFLRRSILTLLEYRGALLQASKEPEFEAKKEPAFHPDATKSQMTQQDLLNRVDAALKFFEKHHKQFKALRNAIGGHFQFSAAQEATTHFEADAIGKLEIKYHNSGQGGGPKLYYAGEVAAVAFTRHLLGNKPRSEKLSDVMQTANEA